jgi:NAD-dependent dihydropyrimidine dehydrogenase PreA subunit
MIMAGGSFQPSQRRIAMCEFCIQHGEGKQWYLQMKNYSTELLHASLTPEQIKDVGFKYRNEWVDDFIRWFVIPGYGGKNSESTQSQDGASAGEIPGVLPGEEQILAQRKIEHFGQVLPIEDVEKVLGMSDSITRMPCGCRYIHTGLTDQRYCFGLGVDVHHMLGKYPDSSASLEVLGKEEALQIIRKFDEEGLMHSVWSGVTPYVIGLCNCDMDCGAYQGYIKNRGIPTFFRAEYICQVDPDQCNGCKECMSQCQFGAQFYSSARGKVFISPELCFGCGVCRATCPQNAISLISRVESPEAANTWLRG